MGSGKFVAVGLLTEGDLDVLGSGLRRVFVLDDQADYAALLARIDEADREKGPGPPASRGRAPRIGG